MRFLVLWFPLFFGSIKTEASNSVRTLVENIMKIMMILFLYMFHLVEKTSPGNQIVVHTREAAARIIWWTCCLTFFRLRQQKIHTRSSAHSLLLNQYRTETDKNKNTLDSPDSKEKNENKEKNMTSSVEGRMVVIFYQTAIWLAWLLTLSQWSDLIVRLYFI